MELPFHVHALRCKANQRSKAVVALRGQIWGMPEFKPWAQIPCPGRGKLTLSQSGLGDENFLSVAALSWPDPRVWSPGLCRRRREPRRHASRPRGCAPLRLSALVQGKPGICSAWGPEGLSLLGGVRARGIRFMGGERGYAFLGPLTGFVYHHFYKYSETMTTACSLACLVKSLPYFKINACRKIKFDLTST